MLFGGGTPFGSGTLIADALYVVFFVWHALLVEERPLVRAL